MCEIRSKLGKKQQNDVNERRSSVVNVNLAQIWHIVLVFSLLPLSK